MATTQKALMQAGKLRHRITIQRPVVGANNSLGEQQTTFQDWIESWAAISPLMGRELDLAKVYTGQLTHKIQIRYRAGITPTCRVAFKGRFFAIHAVLNIDERNREIQLICEEKAA